MAILGPRFKFKELHEMIMNAVCVLLPGPRSYVLCMCSAFNSALALLLLTL